MDKRNRQVNNKKKKINREKIVKKRIEILLTVGSLGLIVGLIIGLILPIGHGKKSELKEVKATNEKIQLQLTNANDKVDELNKKIEENKSFIDLNEEEKEQVISYIETLQEEKKKLDEVKITTTDIYEKLYRSYAYSLGYVNYEEFYAILDTFGYQYEINENDKEITLKDEYAGDNVSLTFEKNNNNELVLTRIRYNKVDKYIELNNNHNKSDTEYIIYDGSSTKVNNINEQEEFLFAE